MIFLSFENCSWKYVHRHRNRRCRCRDPNYAFPRTFETKMKEERNNTQYRRRYSFYLRFTHEEQTRKRNLSQMHMTTSDSIGTKSCCSLQGLLRALELILCHRYSDLPSECCQSVSQHLLSLLTKHLFGGKENFEEINYFVEAMNSSHDLII